MVMLGGQECLALDDTELLSLRLLAMATASSGWLGALYSQVGELERVTVSA